MRPKKRILLFCEDTDRLGRMTFLLMTHGYDVSGSSAESAMVPLLLDNYDAILLLEQSAELEDLTRELKGVAPEITLLLETTKQRLMRTVADRVVWSGMGAAVLLEALRIGTARKRGPKKKYHIIEATPVVVLPAVA